MKWIIASALALVVVLGLIASLERKPAETALPAVLVPQETVVELLEAEPLPLDLPCRVATEPRVRSSPIIEGEPVILRPFAPNPKPTVKSPMSSGPPRSMEYIAARTALLARQEEERWEALKAEPDFREKQVDELVKRWEFRTGKRISDEARHELLAAAHRGWDGDQEGVFAEIVSAFPAE